MVLSAVKKRIRRHLRRIDTLIHCWRLARNERERWKEDHKAFFNFNHPEYQRLFEIEIGAEDIYLMFAGRHARGISMTDYLLEKRLFEQGELS